MIDLTSYYQSSEWNRKRKQRLEIDKHRCRFCDEDGTNYRLEVHHRPSSYAKIPNESVKDDLITVCSFCHQIITERIRQRRYAGQKINIQYRVIEITERTNDHVEILEIPINLRVPPDNTQWRFGESDESSSEGNEESLWETGQDRLRP